MNSPTSKKDSINLTPSERDSYRRDAFDAERGRDLAVGRELAGAFSEKTREEYSRFVADLKRIFAEASVGNTPKK